MPNWTDKVKQIWNSTKNIDDNIEDLIKATIKRTIISNPEALQVSCIATRCIKMLYIVVATIISIITPSM